MWHENDGQHPERKHAKDAGRVQKPSVSVHHCLGFAKTVPTQTNALSELERITLSLKVKE